MPVRLRSPKSGRRCVACLLSASILLVVSLWYFVLAWQTGLFPGTLPLADLASPQEKDVVLVIAPHEDDESLACAGFLSRTAEVGAEAHVCLLTMGEGEELGAVWNTHSLRLTPRSFQRLGDMRRQETLRAMRRLAVDTDKVTFLGYPNNGLDSMWAASNWDRAHLYRSPYLKTDHSPYPDILNPNTPFCGAQLLDDLVTVLRKVRPTIIFTCNPADTHRDHWPTYCFTRLALEQISGEAGGHWVRSARLYTYLVHRPNWPVPLGYFPRESLLPPAPLEDLALNEWLTFPLREEEVLLKRLVVPGYKSQMANSRFNLLLRSFPRQNELFAVINDVPLAALGSWPANDPLAEEPVADNRHVIERPAADLARVQVASIRGWLRVRVETVRPVSPAITYTIVLHQPQVLEGQPRVLQVRLQPGRPTELLAATGGDRLTEQPVPWVKSVATGQIIEVNAAVSAFFKGERVLLDVFTQRGGKYLDHAMTRVAQLPEPVATPPANTPQQVEPQPAGSTRTVSRR